jgi:lysophospholipase L1-like esterase
MMVKQDGGNRMKEKTIQGLLIISAVSSLVWIAGLAWTLQDYFTDKPPAALAAVAQPARPGNKEAPSVVNDDGSFRMVALGDSLTRGTGDESGKGYTGYLTELLKEKTKQEMVMDNLGVNGQTSRQLAAQLGREEVQAQVKAADVLLLSIGGNDLFRGGETLMNLDTEKVKEIEAEAMRELHSVLTELRKLNGAANIFVIGLYNPFIDLTDSEKTTAIVRDWNYKVAETASRIPGTVLVPTFDLFQLKVGSYLSRDQFHPNTEGYRLIAERVAALITW